MTLLQPHCTRVVRTHTNAPRKGSHKRPRLHGLLENLEQRLLLSSLDISGGTLTYAVNTATSEVRITTSGNTLSIYDYNQSISLGFGANISGWTTSGSSVATGPLSSFSSIIVTTSSTDGQELDIEFGNGDSLPAGGVTFAPTPAVGPYARDTLVLGSGSFLSEALASSGPTASTITYSNSDSTNVPITYSNVNSVLDLVTSPTLTFTAPVGSNTINLGYAGSQMYTLDDGGTGAFQSYKFGNKANVTVNANVAGVTTTVDMSTATSNLTQLFINSDAGDDTVIVDALPGNLDTFIDTGSAAGSTIKVGNGSIANIFGPLHVQSTGGANALIIDDAADPFIHSYNLTGSQFFASSFSHPIDISDGFASFSIVGSETGNIFNVTGTAPADLTTINIFGGADDNTLNLTSANPSLDFSTPGTMSLGVGQPTLNYSSLEIINISKPALAPIGAGTSISGTQNQSLANATIASFTQSDLGAAAADFSAVINWGDSITSFGIISSDGNGNFDILGSHTYAATGNYTVSVSLTDAINHGSTSVAGTTINITDTGPIHPLTNPISSSAAIAHGAMLLSVLPLLGTAGLTIPAGEIASFFQTGGPESVSNYAATIAIVDASGHTVLSRFATITAGTAASQYVIYAPALTVPGAGTYHALISLVDAPSGDSVAGSALAVIANALLTAGSPANLTASTGTALSGTLGSFSDANPSASASDFSALIHWADGSTSGGTISQPGGVGTPFTISGTHTYTTAGHYATLIQVTDNDGGALALTSGKVTVTGDQTATSPHLAFVQNPSTAVAGKNINSGIIIDILDANGNLLTSGKAKVTLTIFSGPANGKILGKVTATTKNGVATFKNLSFHVAGDYSLAATASTGYSAAQSSQVTITPAAANSIAFVTPPTTVSRNDPFTVQLKLLDRFGNLVEQNNSNVSLKLRTQPASATLAGTVTRSFDNGLATFSDLSLDLVGSYSLQAVDATLKTSTHTTAT